MFRCFGECSLLGKALVQLVTFAPPAELSPALWLTQTDTTNLMNPKTSSKPVNSKWRKKTHIKTKTVKNKHKRRQANYKVQVWHFVSPDPKSITPWFLWHEQRGQYRPFSGDVRRHLCQYRRGLALPSPWAPAGHCPGQGAETPGNTGKDWGFFSDSLVST